uniref:Large ribosomal subunit protein bL20c n=1 Tax=Actinidia tetramera TaxID=1735015 RepID=A0A1C9CYT8_9ERIC|nr:ribosomal protein L20 [Actinidia tetramera]AON77237.1 ribosomal protein L20 [Actinidia tetramera]
MNTINEGDRTRRPGTDRVNRLFSTAEKCLFEQKRRALIAANLDRDRRKRKFRRLWITRINAVIREIKVSHSYCKLKHGLAKKQMLVNRKLLAQIAILNKTCLYMISNDILK